MLDLHDDEKKLILELEIKTEFEYIVARKDIKDIISNLKKKGKIVIYVSDMYLPKEIMKKLLVANGCYEGDDIFVSCDFNTGKASDLFEYVAEKYEEKKCIHIGDDYNADVTSPLKYGIKSAGIYKASDMFNMAGLGGVAGYMNNIADRIFVGSIINSLFNSPFAFENKYGVARIDTIEKLVDMFFLPVAVEYAWALKKYIAQNDFEGLIFVSRDGYFFKKLYEKLLDCGYVKKLPAYYIYISRILAMSVGVESTSDIEEISSRYLLGNSKNLKTLDKNVLEIIQSETDLKQLQKNRKNYKKYLDKCGIDLKKSYLLCEFDGKGTSQHFIGRLFEKNIKGLYFFSVLSEKTNYIERYYVHSMYKRREYSSLNQRVTFLESIFSSPERSVCGINDDLSFEYKEEVRSQADIVFMLDVQKVILERAVDFIGETDEYKCTISSELVEFLFNNFTVVEFSGDVECLNNIVLSDEVTGRIHDMNF
jgi:hypothetical protein